MYADHDPSLTGFLALYGPDSRILEDTFSPCTRPRGGGGVVLNLFSIIKFLRFFPGYQGFAF